MPGRDRGTRYRYHAIEDGLWDDPKLEGTPFEERGFFVYLCANYRSRPAGIYRATDEQFAADTTLPLARVRAYLADLHQRGGIVRDGAWIFLPGYWARQAHNPGMIVAARSDVQNCTSEIICAAFLKKYPLHSEWLPNGCPTVAERFANGGQKIGSPDQTRPDQTRKDFYISSSAGAARRGIVGHSRGAGAEVQPGGDRQLPRRHDPLDLTAQEGAPSPAAVP